MTKKEFKELCDVHEYGRGKGKCNVIFYDWKVTEDKVGFSWAIKGYVQNIKRKELFDLFYLWVTGKIPYPDPFRTKWKRAMEDKARFKVPIVLSGF